MIPWSGNHICKAVVKDGIMLPWGFLSQIEIKEYVSPSRLSLQLGSSLDRFQHTNYDVIDPKEFAEGAAQAYRHIKDLFERKEDFLLHDVTSPSLSAFLNDVVASYRQNGIVPMINIADVKATLKDVRLDFGGVGKNRYSMGLMSRQEAIYHFLTGVGGPESLLLTEKNEQCPMKLIAEVEYECQEEITYILEETGEVLDYVAGTNKHYWTFETDIGHYTDGVEWQLRNINDVLRPALSLRPELLEKSQQKS